MTLYRKVEDFLLERRRGAETLVVACAGWGEHQQSFQWYRTLAPFSVHRLFVRDRRHLFYRAGVKGLGADTRATVARIKALQQELGAQRLVMLGSSMGGFGALLMGALVDADVVLAFAPQTIVDPKLRADDPLHPEALGFTRDALRTKGLPFPDVAPLVARWSGRATVFFDPEYEPDVAHASRITRFARVSARHVPECMHFPALSLAKNGYLDAILEEALSESFCPATMCPLFARNGSVWNGARNQPCQRTDCDWWGKLASPGCGGVRGAHLAIDEAQREGSGVPIKSGAFDCPRAHECQWQREAGDALCPPRRALAGGLDPLVVGRAARIVGAKLDARSVPEARRQPPRPDRSHTCRRRS